MKALRVSGLLAGVAVALLSVVGCGGGGSSSQTPAQAAQQITTTWENFFGPNGTAQLVQGNTPQLEQTYAKTKSLLGKGSSAHVSSVQLQSNAQCTSAGVPAPCAAVTYTVNVNGSPALKNAMGYATRQGGQWLVSKTTFCALLALESSGSTPAGC